MQTDRPSVIVNPVSLLGIIMAAVALFITIVLLVLGTAGTLANPYTGILTFMLGPAALALGLILIPIGIIRERRRRARFGGDPFPVLNLNDPAQRRGVAIFSVVTAAIVALMATTTWGAAEYMESTEFCADVCHLVMEPEGDAYAQSPHARVSCVACHIGPGAPWLVRSKISGARQVINYTLDNYPRPIPVPIEDLRPSRDTCEECHWTERFYGDKLLTFVHFQEDEENTLRTQPLVFRVGGSEMGHGIHWHTTTNLWYLPLNHSRTEIGWVRVERPDGSVQEYVLPDRQGEVTQERIEAEQRFMDCIDCHNRTAHDYEPVATEIDRAMFEGAISPEIPFIKQQAMQAIGEVEPQVTQEAYDETIARIDAIDAYYQQERPDDYQTYGALVRQSVAALKGIYERSVFPHMNVTPETYPDWATHEGCFRCHGPLVASTGPEAGTPIGANCLTCHYPAPTSPVPPAAAFTGVDPLQLPSSPDHIPANVTHPVDGRENCVSCHQPAGPGAGQPGGTGMPQDHEGRPNETCLGCHAMGPTIAAPAQPAPANGPPPSMTVPHPVQGMEQCSSCHTVGGAGVGARGGTGLPQNHEGRPDASCLGCHQTSGNGSPAAPATPAPAATQAPAATPAPPVAQPAQPTAPPAAQPPAAAEIATIPHPLQGMEQCSTCHTVGGAGAGTQGGTGLPADHQGRADATCTGCHQQP